MTIKGLTCKVLAKKGKIAEIEIEGQKIKIPSEHLPASVEVGNGFQIYLLDESSGRIQEKNLAKLILEEILNGR